MKILILCPLLGRTSIEMSAFCKKALISNGHTVDIFYYDTRLSMRVNLLKSLEEKGNLLRLKKILLKTSPDFILVIKGDRIPVTTITYVREHFGIPIGNYWIDDPYRIEISSKLSPFYDYFFTTDRKSIGIHQQAGCPRVGLVTYGIAPELHRQIPLSQEDVKNFGSDICFAGTVSVKRKEILESLTEFDLKIWAPRYISRLEKDYKIVKEKLSLSSPLYHKFTNRSVWGEELVKVYNASKIVINIHDPQTCLIMRDFEVPGCGAFLLTDPAERMEDFFCIGKEIVCFQNLKELRVLIEYYLAHPEERKLIAQKGYEKVSQQHTYQHRMQEILSFVKE